MLTSRNPQGEIEAYTDIGQFIGILPPDYPGLDLGEYADDGGPGSGNWGHKGRPGKRGGSGKGGGKRYRGGRSDVRFVGARKDWLNGLSGERQLEAARFLTKNKRDLRSRQLMKSKLEDLAKKGMISPEDARERIKEANVGNVRENMTAEEYIMENGSMKDKSKLLELASEARSWGEFKDQYKKENLTEDETKIFDYMEANFPTLDETGINSYMELKAKAMGLIEKTGEIPDEIQYEAGTKERPAPPKPEGPDMSWYDKPRSWKSDNLEHYMEIALGETPSYAKTYTKDDFLEVNQRFLDKLKYGELGINEARVAKSALVRLREAMYPTYAYGSKPGQGFQYTPDKYKNLTDGEKERLLQIAEAFSPTFSGRESVDEIDDNTITQIESAISSRTLRAKAERKLVQDYVLLQEKILGGFEPSSTNTLEETAKQQAAEANAEAQKRAETFRKENEEFQNSPKAAAKREAQAKIRELDIESLRNVRNLDNVDIERVMNGTGVFAEGKHFVTDHTIPTESYLDAAEAYKKVLTKYPFMAGEMGGFGDHYPSRRAIAGCYVDAYKNPSEIIINFDIFRDRERQNFSRKLAVKDYKHKVEIDDNVSAAHATICHELGHSLSNWLHRAAYGAFKEKLDKKTREVSDINQVADEIQAATLKAMKLRRTKENITNNVSAYAFEDSNEFFAECFCELMCSSKPRPVAVEFGKQLDRFIREHGITENTTATVPSAMYQSIPYYA